MTTTAKSLAAGFPVGALMVSSAIASEIGIGDLGSTYGGGPLAMACPGQRLTPMTVCYVQAGERTSRATRRQTPSFRCR